MTLVDQILENVVGIEREDRDEKTWQEDLYDSIGSGLFSIDNIVERVDTRISEVDDKLVEAEEKLSTVDNKLKEVDVHIGLIELKVSAFLILSSLVIADVYRSFGMTNRMYLFIGIAILISIEAAFSIYRSIFGDIIAKKIVEKTEERNKKDKEIEELRKRLDD